MNENNKPWKLTAEQAEELFKGMKMVSLKKPKFKRRIQGMCDNCAEYIVCWGMDEPIKEEIPNRCKYAP